MLQLRRPPGVCATQKSQIWPAKPTRVTRRAGPAPSAAHGVLLAPQGRQPRNGLLTRFKNGETDASGEDADEQQRNAAGVDTALLVPVVFELGKHCQFGQAFAVVGDAPQLGEWDVSKALKLEWSEGDVWTGMAQLPLDTPVDFKYVQINGAGGLVAWGQDVAGGANISLMVTADDEGMAGLTLVLDPPEAADASQQPYLLARLDTSAILPDSTDTADETAAAADTNGFVAAGAALELQLSPEAEADAVMAADEVDGLAVVDSSTAEADEQQQQQGVGGGDEGFLDTLDQLQLLGEELQAGQGEEEQQQEGQWQAVEDFVQSGPEGLVVGAFTQAPPDTTSEPVQQQGLQPVTDTETETETETNTDTAMETESEMESEVESDIEAPLIAAATAAAAAVAAPGGVASGGVAAGYEDPASVGAAVQAGLLEAGDGETAAGFTGPADPFTPHATPASSSSSSSDSSSGIRSYVISTSLDQQDSEADEEDDSSPADVSSSSSSIDSSGSVIDITPPGLPDTEALLAATAQEGARLAAAESTPATAAAAAGANGAPTSPAADDSRSSLEGLPTAADSDAAAVADSMFGSVAAAESVPAAAELEACRPPTPHSKLVAADAAFTTVDPDAPLAADKAAITEIDSSSKGVHPVDSYEDSFGALAALAAAAVAASQSLDGPHHEQQQQQGREGAGEAAAEREVQLVRAEERGDGDGTGTWTGRAAAGGGEPAAAAGGGGAAVDREGTGTWTATAEGATPADGSSGESAQRATEEGAGGAASPTGGKKQRNWFQRLFGGGGDEDDRA